MAEPVSAMPSRLGFGDEDQDMTPPSEIPIKDRTRQRILLGMHRISSSPSLSILGRPKSDGSPYPHRSTLSCVSLDTTTSPTPQSFPSSMASASTSVHAAPPYEFPFEVETDELLAIRKVNHGRPMTSPVSAPLPSSVVSSKMAQKPTFRFWDKMPDELRVYIFSFLRPKELVRASNVSKSFYGFCFDGQLWAFLDASEFYRDIPAASLTRIIATAGPFIKTLNLRGCVQMEHFKRTDIIVKSCKNLVDATLEGCRNFQKQTLHNLLKSNVNLVRLNLTGLAAVSNVSCAVIAESCPHLESLNVSWCQKVDAYGLKQVITACARLRDLRAGEVRGFDSVETAVSIFETNRLERLVLSGCSELTDESLKAMLHGIDPMVDLLTNLPLVPPRKLRHLDLSRCLRLTSDGVKHIGHVTPYLEGLQLSGCKSLTDAALEPILKSTPRLTHLELDDLEEITNAILADHLAKAPCASRLEHLSLSYCENIGDPGMLPVMQNCARLRSVVLDNTRISDLMLAEAASMVTKRSRRCTDETTRPKTTLQLAVYDCQNVTWNGIHQVLFRNSHMMPASAAEPGEQMTYPAEVIGLKCFYGFQMTVDEHQKRVLRGDIASAARLDRKWAEYMQINEEGGPGGMASRRRRRRARDAHVFQLNDDDDGSVVGRRRARTLGSCAMM